MEKNFYNRWENNNSKNAEIDAIDYFGNKINFNDAKNTIIKLENGFESLRNDKDSSVSICATTTPKTLMSLYALNKAGIQTNFMSAGELASNPEKYINETNTETLVIQEAFYTQVAEAIAKTSVKNIIIASFLDDIGDESILLDKIKKSKNLPFFVPKSTILKSLESAEQNIKNKAIPGKEYFTLSELSNSTNIDRNNNTINSDDKTALLVYTSGTTGDPKGVELTNNSILEVNNMFNGQLDPLNLFKPGERFLNLIPLNHVTALVACDITAWNRGITQVLQPI